MAFRFISELPFIRCDGVRTGELDNRGALHLNLITSDARGFGFYAGIEDHPVNGGIYRLFRIVVNNDGYNNTNGVWQAAFDGRTLIRDPSTPVAELESYAFPFDGDTSLGARFSDFSVVKWFNGTAHEFLLIQIVNDHQVDGRNYTGLLKSLDEGLTWTFVQEVLHPNGGNMGTPFGAVWNDGTDPTILWGLVGDGTGGQRLFKSVDGARTWTDKGLVIDVGTDAFDPNATAMPVGRFVKQVGNTVFTIQNNSRITGDWPKSQSLWYTDVANLEAGAKWTEREFPITAAPPMSGGIWQGNYIETQNGNFMLVNSWGEVGADEIGTADALLLHDNAYYNIAGGYGRKHIYTLKQDWSGLFDYPDWMPLVDGGKFQLRYGGQFLATQDVVPVNQGGLTMIDNGSDARTIWQAEKQTKHFGIHPAADLSLAIKHPGLDSYGGRSKEKLPLVTGGWSATNTATNQEAHWLPLLVGHGQTRRAAFWNRETQLHMFPGGYQAMDLGGPDSVWEIVPVSP